MRLPWEQSGHPLVTAWVTCYNQKNYIAETLDSVRAQTYPNLELIVCDDCSSDGSPEIIREWIAQHWPEACFLEHQENMGICKTLNEILSVAHGKYLAGVAGDDHWMPEKTARQVAILESCPSQVGVLFGDASLMDESGVPRAERYFGAVLPGHLREELLSRVTLWPKEWICGGEGHPSAAALRSAGGGAVLFTQRKREEFFQLLIQANVIPAMTAMVRKACYDRVGAYDESLFFEDWDMWIRISRQFSFVFFGEPTARYRLHNGSISRTHQKEIRHSIEAMFRKYAKKNWLKGTDKEEAGEIFLKQHALQLYRDGSTKRHGELFWLAWRVRRREYAFLFVCSILGMSYGRYLSLHQSLFRSG